MARGGEVRAGKAFVELYLKNTLAKGLRGAGKQMKAFGKSLGYIGAGISAMGAAITGPLVAAIHMFSDVGDELALLSERASVSTEFLSALGYAARFSGVGLETLQRSIVMMQKNAFAAAKSGKKAADSFGLIGVSVKDANGNIKPTEQLFMETVAALSAVDDGVKKTAVAMKIFGRGGTALIPMLTEGAAGIKSLMQEARDLGVTLSAEDVAAAVAFTKAMLKLKLAAYGVMVRLGAQLAPTVTDLAKRIMVVVRPIIDFIKQNGSLVIMAAKVGIAISAIGAAFVGLGSICFAAGVALTGFGAVAGAIGTVLEAIMSPIGLVVAGIAMLGYYILFHTQSGAAALAWLGERFNDLLAFVKPIIQGIKDALSAGDIALAAEVLWLGIKVAFNEGKTAIMAVWREFTTGIVQMFDEAMNAIIAKWRKMNTSIAELLIRLGDKLGLLGNLKADDVIATLREDSARAQKGSEGRLAGRTDARGAELTAAAKADKAALAQSKAELAKVIGKAAVKAELARMPKLEVPEPPPSPKIPEILPAGGEAVGTFSAAAAARLGFGSEQIRLLESIDDRLSELNDTVEDAEEWTFA